MIRLLGRGLSMAVRRSLAALAVVAALTAAGCSGVSDANQSPPAPVAEPRLGADRVLTGLVYAQRDSGPLQLDLYLPADDSAPRPLVLYAHGGGWNAGSRSLTANLRAAEAVATQRLLEAGYAVASVDYRLTQVAKAPAQVV
ncbi:MAG: alpha/beta hydrolase, partial [Saccharopolyspora rectivirgula]